MIRTVKQKIAILVLSLFSALMVISPMTAYAATGKRIILAPLINEQNNTLDIVQVENKDNEILGVWEYSDSDLEEKFGVFENGRRPLVFPGIDATKEGEWGTSSLDTHRAGYVGEIASRSINSIIATVRSLNKDVTLDEIIDCIANQGTSIGDGSVSVVWENVEEIPTEMTNQTEGEGVGTTSANFRRVTITSNEVSKYVEIQTEIPKGYASGQKLHDEIVKRVGGEDNYEAYVDKTEFVSIHDVCKAAIEAKDSGITASDADKLNKKSTFDEMIETFLLNLYTGIQNFLGLYTLGEMFFNIGARNSLYYLGMMPNDWIDAADFLYWIALIGAFFVLVYSLITMLIKKNLASVTPSMRVEIKDSILNVCIAILLLMLFKPLFYILGSVNYEMVKVFSSLSVNPDIVFGGLITTGFINPAVGIFFGFFYLAILLKINIEYLTRAVVLTILYVFAPIFISFIAYNRKSPLFSVWLRELLGNLFIQLFDSVALCIVATALGSGGRIVEKLMLLFIISCIHKWFKDVFSNKLLQLSNSSTQMANDTMKNIGAAVQGVTVAAGAGAVASAAGKAGSAISKVAEGFEKPKTAVKNFLNGNGGATKDAAGGDSSTKGSTQAVKGEIGTGGGSATSEAKPEKPFNKQANVNTTTAETANKVNSNNVNSIKEGATSGENSSSSAKSNINTPAGNSVVGEGEAQKDSINTELAEQQETVSSENEAQKDSINTETAENADVEGNEDASEEASTKLPEHQEVGNLENEAQKDANTGENKEQRMIPQNVEEAKAYENEARKAEEAVVKQDQKNKKDLKYARAAAAGAIVGLAMSGHDTHWMTDVAVSKGIARKEQDDAKKLETAKANTKKAQETRERMENQQAEQQKRDLQRKQEAEARELQRKQEAQAREEQRKKEAEAKKAKEAEEKAKREREEHQKRREENHKKANQPQPKSRK